MEDNIILKMEGISKQFGGIHALNDVSINFERNKVNVIMGETAQENQR